MQLQVTGRHIDIGDALRQQVSSRLADALAKYFAGGWSGHVTIEREGSGFRAECRVHLDSGIDLQSHGTAPDAYQCFEQAAGRIETRLQKYKQRLKHHHVRHAAEEGRGDEPQAATSYVIAAPGEDEDEAAPPTDDNPDDNPIIIAETRTKVRRMTVGMAVMALDLAQSPVVVFRNIANDRLNIVYRRDDGNIGWVDPSENGDKEARG